MSQAEDLLRARFSIRAAKQRVRQLQWEAMKAVDIYTFPCGQGGCGALPGHRCVKVSREPYPGCHVPRWKAAEAALLEKK